MKDRTAVGQSLVRRWFVESISSMADVSKISRAKLNASYDLRRRDPVEAGWPEPTTSGNHTPTVCRREL